MKKHHMTLQLKTADQTLCQENPAGTLHQARMEGRQPRKQS